MLAYPAPTPYDLNFRLMGIPVRVHPIFWLVGAMLGARTTDLTSIMVWIGALFISILLHEMGHALVARAYGASPSIILFGFGGVTVFDRVPGWMARIVITAAGPCIGFLFAAILFFAVFLPGLGPELQLSIREFIEAKPLLYRLVQSLLLLNIFWGLINLLPVFPLDGGQIARELWVRMNPHGGIRQSLILSIIAAVGAAIASILILRELFLTLMFAFLAYGSYQQLNSQPRVRYWS